MSIILQRPGEAPPWFTGFYNWLERALNGADRRNMKFLRKDFTKADANTSLTIGPLPANAVIVPSSSGAIVNEVFNAATTNTFAMGTAASPTLYGTGKPLTALGQIALTAAVSYLPSTTVATEIKGTITTTGAAATTGKGVFVVAYLVQQEA